MKRFLKSLLFKILGIKLYLRLLYRSFAFLIETGLLKGKQKFYLHYFSKEIIQKGDVVLDIGANLGYFTRLFLKATGNKGTVYAVEPVYPFFKNLTYFLGKKENLTLYNCALGEEEKEIQLTVPNRYGYIRTGLPKVYNKEEMEIADHHLFFDAKMKKGSQLFKEIKKLDYLKMDVEGHEKYIIPEIKAFISATLPCIQIELSTKDTKEKVEEVLSSLGYETYFFQNKKLTRTLIKGYAQDYFYIHPLKKEKYKHLIR